MSISIGPILWFSYADIYSGLEGGWASWGLLDGSYNPKPSYKAYKVMTEVLREAVYVSPMGDSGYAFTLPSGQSLYVLWGTGTWSMLEVPERILDALGNTLTPTNPVVLSDSPIYVFMPKKVSPVTYEKRVNCGGNTYTDAGGNLWSADQPYNGDWGYIGGFAYTVISDIANTLDDPLYKSTRWWSNSVYPGYRFTVPNGQYEVTLKLSEVYAWAVNQRKFSVRIEGVTVISSLDMFAEAGGSNIALVDKTFVTSVPDGELTIDFIQIVGYNNSQVNAIEVRKIN
jgi:hypothetical protein